MWCPIYTHVGRWEKNIRMRSDISDTFGPFGQKKWNSQIKGYAYSIHSIDLDIKYMTDALADNNLENNTIIIFGSDNGAFVDGSGSYFFGSNGGRRGSKGTMYEGGVSVPLIIRFSGTIFPEINFYPFSYHDIPKTLLDVIKAPKNILEEFEKVDSNTVSIVNFPERTWLKTINCKNATSCQSSIMNIRNWTFSLPKLIFDGNMYSLFDIKNDPRESVDLINNKNYTETVEIMKKKLKKILP